jgi:hypothetical protein
MSKILKKPDAPEINDPVNRFPLMRKRRDGHGTRQDGHGDVFRSKRSSESDRSLYSFWLFAYKTAAAKFGIVHHHWRKGGEGPGLATMVSGDLAAPAMS